MHLTELHWLAGYLEGEGTFAKGPPSSPNLPIMQVCSTDEDVIARVAKIFGVKYHVGKRKKKNPKHKPIWFVRKSGFIAVQMMQKIKPLMSARRQRQIGRAIASYSAKSHRLTHKEIAQIRSLAAQRKLTQSQIAAKFGIRREWVNRIKNNKYHAMSDLG